MHKLTALVVGLISFLTPCFDASAQGVVYHPSVDPSIPSQMQMDVVVTASVNAQKRHLDISFAAPNAPLAVPQNMYSSITMYSFRLSNGIRSDDRSYNTTQGTWTAGSPINIAVDVPNAYYSPNSGWQLRFCIGSQQGCIMSQNLLTGAPPSPSLDAQQNPPLNFSAVGSQAQQIGIQCAQRSQGQLNAFVQCASQQVVLPPKQQMMIDCAARSGGNSSNFAVCAGGNIMGLNPEQQIAVQCVVETQGQPYAAAACTATRLTQRELQKCFTDGIGGQNGCFGDNNDLVGHNGWTARSFQNVVSDIQNGPGPTNDLVGQNGFVVRTVDNMRSDIANGPGRNNDIVGCNGWVNKNLFGGGC